MISSINQIPTFVSKRQFKIQKTRNLKPYVYKLPLHLINYPNNHNTQESLINDEQIALEAMILLKESNVQNTPKVYEHKNMDNEEQSKDGYSSGKLYPVALLDFELPLKIKELETFRRFERC